MTWVVLSLLTALAVASQDACTKKFFSHLTVSEMAAHPLVYSFPFFVAATLLAPKPETGTAFYIYFIAGIPINGVAFMMYMKAIQISPLSLTVPYLAFTPVFMILTGMMFLNEKPDVWGGVGIVATCAGSYVLNLTPGKFNYLDPFKAVFRETGSWMMLLTAFLYSFAAVIGKKAILLSSPLYYSVAFFAAFNFTLVLSLVLMGKIRPIIFKTVSGKGVFLGCLVFAHILLHGFAISMAKAAYMVSVKRLSILFSIVYSKIIFRETNLRIRFYGAALMLAGAVMISLKGT